jgi:N-carbamoylputrescine amidase
MTFSVGLLQLSPKELDPAFNLGKGLEACRKAKALGTELALFPEMWNIGYAFCPPQASTE